MEAPRKIGDPPGLTCKACWDTHHPPQPGTDLQGMLGYLPRPVVRILDTRLWKYYLGQNFVSAGNNAKFRAYLKSSYRIESFNIHVGLVQWSSGDAKQA